MALSRHLTLAAVVLLVAATAASAQTSYPTKPVTLLVPFGVGGATDLAARAIAQAIPPHLGQPVVVVNKPGAAGAVAWQTMLAAPADGYTVMMAAIGTHGTLPAVNPNLPFKHDQFTALARTQINPTVVVVKADAPWRSLRELTGTIGQRPRVVRAGVSGIGAAPHLALEILIKTAGLPKGSLAIIPFKSGSETMTAVLGGHVDVTWTNLIEALPQLKAGQVRALAVEPTAPGRRPIDLPETPTFSDAGFPQMNIVGWRGVLGPPGLSPAVIEKWETALRKMAEDRAWQDAIVKLGDEPAYQTGPDFKRFIDSEYRRYKAIASDVGIVAGQ